MITELLVLLITLVIVGIIYYLITRHILVGVLSKHYSKKQSVKYVNEYIVINDTIIDKGDPYEIIDPVWWSVTIYNGEDEYLNNLKQFSLNQRYINAIIWYEAEVNNGGHDQFYFNSTGIVWKDALEGLKIIGAYQYAEILEESIKRFGENPSLDRFTRQAQMEKADPSFDDLDDLFYQLQSEISFATLMGDFIKNNREDFYFVGEVTKPKSAKFLQ